MKDIPKVNDIKWNDEIKMRKELIMLVMYLLYLVEIIFKFVGVKIRK